MLCVPTQVYTRVLFHQPVGGGSVLHFSVVVLRYAFMIMVPLIPIATKRRRFKPPKSKITRNDVHL